MKYIATPLLISATIASLLYFNAASSSERGSAADVIPANNPVYVKECGSCHMPYSPGLLPARSWSALMGKLNDHFGDNAELDNATHTAILSYLTTNSADNSHYRRSQRLMRTINANDTPLRISEVPYIKREHHELPARVFKTRPELKSLSQCDGCHTQAAKGSFAEHEINLPGVGRYED